MRENDAGTKKQSPVNFVFACSGAADVGNVADQAARILARENTASMCCTAAVAAQIADIIKKVKTADQILAIDGCEHRCSEKVLLEGGFDEIVHMDLSRMGMEKGKTPPAVDTVARVADAARAALKKK